MKIARYWAKGKATVTASSGKQFEIASWRWSADSQEDAERNAHDAAQTAARRFETGDLPQDGYAYSERPPREEICEEIKNGKGETIATITRNSYGALVLNTQGLMFIDVDIPRESTFAGMLRRLKRFFGVDAEDPEIRTRNRIAATAQASIGYTIRLYRTYAGFRCAIVDRSIDPGSLESHRLLTRFEADPLYIRLCKNQECYRARLTPKYWRCGARRPPNRFPWSSSADEQAYRSWEAHYEARIEGYATCRLVEQYGSGQSHREWKALIDLHDKMTGAGMDRALA